MFELWTKLPDGTARRIFTENLVTEKLATNDEAKASLAGYTASEIENNVLTCKNLYHIRNLLGGGGLSKPIVSDTALTVGTAVNQTITLADYDYLEFTIGYSADDTVWNGTVAVGDLNATLTDGLNYGLMYYNNRRDARVFTIDEVNATVQNVGQDFGFHIDSHGALAWYNGVLYALAGPTSSVNLWSLTSSSSLTAAPRYR